tara:strand:+ start:1036 stop:1695 length:660 start_codon:yes stop_codon:yes gene_type:complete
MDNKQLILNLRTLPAMNRNDYFVNVTNSEAVEWIDMWPNWPYFGFIVYGSKSSGKSHLASVLKSISKGKMISAKNITKNNIEEFSNINCLIIENFEQLVFENAFFHLFNMCKENNNKIMLTSAVSPSKIEFKLPDLKSRILSLPSVELKFPDDELLKNIILKQFLDKGVKVEKEVIDFLLKRVDRSFDSIYNLVSKIDFASMEKSRKITIPFVKKFIKD